MLSSKQFWVKKVVKLEYFYVQIIFRPEKGGYKKIWGLQIFRSTKILDRQKCLCQTNFRPKSLGPKKFGSNKFWSKIID